MSQKRFNQLKESLKLLENDIFYLQKTCKENLGKPFSEVLLAVPKLNLQEKQSAYEKKKQRLRNQRQLKASVETLWNQSDVDAHLAQEHLWPQEQSNAPFSHLKHYKKQNHDLKKAHLV